MSTAFWGIVPAIIAGAVSAFGIIMNGKRSTQKRFEQMEKLVDDLKTAFDTQFREIKQHLNENDMTTKRTEFVLYVKCFPAQVQVIERLYDEYKHIPGADHYVDSLHTAWEKEYADEIIRHRISAYVTP